MSLFERVIIIIRIRCKYRTQIEMLIISIVNFTNKLAILIPCQNSNSLAQTETYMTKTELNFIQLHTPTSTKLKKYQDHKTSFLINQKKPTWILLQPFLSHLTDYKSKFNLANVND